MDAGAFEKIPKRAPCFLLARVWLLPETHLETIFFGSFGALYLRASLLSASL